MFGKTHRNSILIFLKHLQNRATQLSPSVESSRRPPALHRGPANPLEGLGTFVRDPDAQDPNMGKNDKRQTICCDMLCIK